MAQRIGTYANEAARQRFERIHRAALASLPDHRIEHVRTDFGTVQAMTLGAAASTPVVLLHGMSCTSAMWAPNLPALARHHHLIALDTIIDCGGSHQTVPVIDRADHVRNVAQALDGLGVRRAHFVGLSYGAWIAAACAVERPEMVATLSLLEPAGTLHGIGLAYVRGFLASFLRKSPRRWDFLFHRRPSDHLIGLLDASRGFRPRAPLPAAVTDAELAGVAVPVQVVLGDRSTACSIAKTRARVSAIPDGEVHVVEHAGHMVSVDQPDEVDRLLLDFLGRA